MRESDILIVRMTNNDFELNFILLDFETTCILIWSVRYRLRLDCTVLYICCLLD